MILSPTLSPIILDTILTHLAVLFLTSANGNSAIARDAASQMLAAYQPENEAELSLASDIVSFSFQALEALSQAATPDTPLPKVLRLRGSAVSLSREAHKAQRKLDQQQKARVLRQPDETVLAAPDQTEAAAPRDAVRQAPPAGTRQPRQTWTQAYQQRQTARRIAKSQKKQQKMLPVTQILASACADRPAQVS